MCHQSPLFQGRKIGPPTWHSGLYTLEPGEQGGHGDARARHILQQCVERIRGPRFLRAGQLCMAIFPFQLGDAAAERADQCKPPGLCIAPQFKYCRERLR